MKKRLFLVLMVFFMVFLSACGQGSSSGEGTETLVTEPVFISDYAPGEENTRSSTARSFCIQQGNWLYYTSYKNRFHDSKADYILKYPIGGSAEQVQKILAQGNIQEGLLNCEVCNNGVVEFVSLEAVMGDWIYVNMKDGHMIRLLTDGSIAECILCPHPEEMVANLCLAFRDNYMYYAEQVTRHLDASTTASTYYLHKMNLETRSTKEVGEIVWEPDDFSSCYAVFQDDGSFCVDGGSCIAVINPDDEISVFNFSFTYEKVKNASAGYRLMPGVSSSLIFSSNYKAYAPNGLYSLGINDLGNLPSDFVVPKAEFQSRSVWSVWGNFLLPGGDEIGRDGLYWIVDVDKGYACNLNDKEGLIFYSVYDRNIHKINNDIGEHLFWSDSEGFLYYQTRTGGEYYLCRVSLDGTEWEDVSWLTYIPEGETKPLFG